MQEYACRRIGEERRLNEAKKNLRTYGISI